MIPINTLKEIKLSLPRKRRSFLFKKKKLRRAPEVRILSARGSRNCPHLVLKPYFLAYQPSYQSVRAAIEKTKKDIITRASLSDKNRKINTGDSNILKTLNVLGKFKNLKF